LENPKRVLCQSHGIVTCLAPWGSSCFREQYRNSPYRVCSLALPCRTPHLPGLHRCCLDVTSRHARTCPGNNPIVLSLVQLDSSRNNLAGERVAPTNGMTNPFHSKILLSCMTQRKVRHFLQLGPLGKGNCPSSGRCRASNLAVVS